MGRLQGRQIGGEHQNDSIRPLQGQEGEEISRGREIEDDIPVIGAEIDQKVMQSGGQGVFDPSVLNTSPVHILQDLVFHRPSIGKQPGKAVQLRRLLRGQAMEEEEIPQHAVVILLTRGSQEVEP